MTTTDRDATGRARRRTSRRAGGIAVLLAGGLLLSACGGSDSTDDAQEPATTPSTAATADDTTGGSTTSTEEAAEAEPSPAVVAATLTAADLGGDWADYPESAEVVGEDNPNACPDPEGLVGALDPSMRGEGAIIQKGDRSAFLQSDAWVFPDAAAAEAFLAHRMSEDFAECRRAELEADQQELNADVTVASLGIEPSDGSTPYRGAVSYELRVDVDGTAQTAGFARHLLYLKGTTVIDVFDQGAGLPDDPPGLDEQISEELNAGMDAVLARVAG